MSNGAGDYNTLLRLEVRSRGRDHWQPGEYSSAADGDSVKRLIIEDGEDDHLLLSEMSKSIICIFRNSSVLSTCSRDMLG